MTCKRFRLIFSGCGLLIIILLNTPIVSCGHDAESIAPAAVPASTPKLAGLPTIPSGAVYFRKSGPPRDDWLRDHAQAAADGMNSFRHWFPWSTIEIAPGKFDWADYDEQFDLAAKHGI